MAGREQRQHAELPPDLALLLDALRGEFNAKITGLKLWGSLALVGGGTLGGVISRLAFPDQTGSALGSLSRLFS